MRKTHEAVTTGGSALTRYQDVVVGSRSFNALVNYELRMMMSPLPGATGLLLRKIFWPRLFGSCGQGVVFAEGITLRHPHRIKLGDRIVISERCTLDARNEAENQVIDIGDDAILSSNVMISCKAGSVKIGARSGIGAYTIIHSANNNPVYIGSDVIMGPNCYIVGGGNYNIGRLDIPMWRQGIKNDGGVHLADDIWLGSNVIVLGGVKIETGAVAAAGSIITKNVPSRVICAGQPARVIRRLNGKE